MGCALEKKEPLAAEGWREIMASSSSKNQGRKLTVETSFPVITAVITTVYRQLFAITVAICCDNFPRLKRNEGIPPMHRYLFFLLQHYAYPGEQLVFMHELVCPLLQQSNPVDVCPDAMWQEILLCPAEQAAVEMRLYSSCRRPSA